MPTLHSSSIRLLSSALRKQTQRHFSSPRLAVALPKQPSHRVLFSSTVTNAATPSSSRQSEGGEDATKTNERLSRYLLSLVKLKVDSNDVNEADALLRLAAKFASEPTADYLHLLSSIRLKQHRVEAAMEACEELLRRFPEMRKYPAVLSQIGYVHVQLKKYERALELLDETDQLTKTPTKDSLYSRALALSGLNQLEKCEELLKSVVLSNGQLIPLKDGADVKLALLLIEILVLREKPAEAEPLTGPVIEASTSLHGSNHAMTLCTQEGKAAVWRALGKHKEALEILRPVTIELTKQLGTHELSLASTTLLANTMMDIFIQTQVDSITQKKPIDWEFASSLNRALLNWEKMAAALKDSAATKNATSQRKLYDILVNHAKGGTGAATAAAAAAKPSPKSAPSGGGQTATPRTPSGPPRTTPRPRPPPPPPRQQKQGAGAGSDGAGQGQPRGNRQQQQQQRQSTRPQRPPRKQQQQQQQPAPSSPASSSSSSAASSSPSSAQSTTPDTSAAAAAAAVAPSAPSSAAPLSSAAPSSSSNPSSPSPVSSDATSTPAATSTTTTPSASPVAAEPGTTPAPSPSSPATPTDSSVTSAASPTSQPTATSTPSP